MAIIKLPKTGYGQLELNKVAFRRDGRVEAQCALDATEFPATATAIGSVAENGMLLAINKAARKVVKATTALATAGTVIGINYTTEHMYDERKPQLSNFYLTSGTFLPRIGLLEVGDTFHTNTVCFDEAAYDDEEAIEDALTAGTPVYAGIATDGTGYWQVVATKPAVGPVAEVVEYGTMPDGQIGLKLHVLKV